MDKSLIIILAVILLILVLLNNLSILVPTTQVHTEISNQGNCSQTKFGCCPDGVNSKINFNGTNCPKYNPGAGYPSAYNKPTVIVTHT
jgi:hypothetical protein